MSEAQWKLTGRRRQRGAQSGLAKGKQEKEEGKEGKDEAPDLPTRHLIHSVQDPRHCLDVSWSWISPPWSSQHLCPSTAWPSSALLCGAPWPCWCCSPCPRLHQVRSSPSAFEGGCCAFEQSMAVPFLAWVVLLLIVIIMGAGCAGFVAPEEMRARCH